MRDQSDDQIKILMDERVKVLSKDLLLSDIKPPSVFNLQKISDKSKYSHTITICVSGYTSEDEDKKNKWQSMFQDYGSEVFALIWKSGTLGKLQDYGFKGLTSALALGIAGGPITLAAGAIGGLALAYNCNPFQQAYVEAIATGRYLGQLIAKEELFQYNQINVIGFSLGTVVIYNMLKQIELYQAANPKKIINQVILLGGAADLKEIEKLQFKCLNSIVNVYSKKDEVLSKLLKLTQFDTKPCGLNPIQNFGRMSEIQNYDISMFVNGHMKYKPYFSEIFQEVDFENDIKIQMLI